MIPRSKSYKLVDPTGIIAQEGSKSEMCKAIRKVGSPGYSIGISYDKKIGDKWQ